MCNLCNKIYNKKELKQWFTDSVAWFNNNVAIPNNIITLEEDKYYFYTAIDDYYYTPQTSFKINYCPVCGRKLAED